MDADDPTDFDLPARADVDDGIAFADRSLINPDIGKLPKGAVFQLKGQCHQRLVFVSGKEHWRFVSFHVQGMVFNIRGAGQ